MVTVILVAYVDSRGKGDLGELTVEVGRGGQTEGLFRLITSEPVVQHMGNRGILMESDEWEIEHWLHESSAVDDDDGLYVCEAGRYNTENDQHQSRG